MEATKLIVKGKREESNIVFALKNGKKVGRIEPDGVKYACWAVGEPEGTIWYESKQVDAIDSVSEAIDRFFFEFGIEVEYIG